MTDTDEAVETFLTETETVFEEYDQGYMNPDVALERLRGHIEDLDEATD
ncbi:hypothetical protein [Halorientalis regularis]|jgi:hypothetical protein|uniref:Uncharacterized protein n=1 Tax=Halorientalis regularis TaxID=660518 RepID=A0A1G7PCF4_9EURY|nr:hypothetical protein [Halorientalis regularis]SDF83319.1 hypothetical protein SAMN05216218_11046 [Halorientalis regularis]